MKAKEDELRKAQAKVMRLEGKLIKSHDAAVTTSELKAKLEATEDQERIVSALVISKFLALEERTKIKSSNYNDGVRYFLYTVATERPDPCQGDEHLGC